MTAGNAKITQINGIKNKCRMEIFLQKIKNNKIGKTNTACIFAAKARPKNKHPLFGASFRQKYFFIGFNQIS